MAKDYTAYDGQELAIIEGELVAFNLSGSIAIGRVESISHKVRKITWGSGEAVDYTFKIRMTKPMHGFPSGHVSTVKQPSSILVL